MADAFDEDSDSSVEVSGKSIPWDADWMKELLLGHVYGNKVHIAKHGTVGKAWNDLVAELKTNRKLSSFRPVDAAMFKKKYNEYLASVKVLMQEKNKSRLNQPKMWQQTAMYILSDIDKFEEEKSQQNKEEVRKNQRLLMAEDEALGTNFNTGDLSDSENDGDANEGVSSSSSRPPRKRAKRNDSSPAQDPIANAILAFVALEKQKLEFEILKYKESKS